MIGCRVRLGVRHKLILLGTLVILVISSGFTAINLVLARRAIEEDLKTRAIIYAREIAATIGHRSELESRRELQQLITRLLAIRKSVLQLDVLAFHPDETTVVATNMAHTRVPFSRLDGNDVRNGRIVSRAVTTRTERYWEVMAPVTLDGAVAGAVAVKFSSERADELTSRIRFWSLTLVAVSVVLMGLLMSASIQLVVDRPIRRFMEAISAVAHDGVPATVSVTTADEFGVLARRFNEMVSRIGRFNDELRTRIAEATGEIDRRYQEVEHLNTLLYEMQRRLSRAERLALSGRVMAEVAHEVGTPLHSVAGHLELLRKDLPRAVLTDDVARRLTIIEAQVNRVIDIIARLLDVTRRASGEPGPVDLERLARDTVELVRPGLATTGVALDVRSEPGLPVVRGQPDQLQQVILNLLTNAIDATPSGGRIEVTIVAEPGRGEIEIAITDTGRGISAEDRKRIFEPFFSTKEPGRGTGLGLFISAEIVREHKGRIEIESETGRGSTFRIVLPVTGSAA
jgi:two-component system, NtrC family, sensor kinase